VFSSWPAIGVKDETSLEKLKMVSGCCFVKMAGFRDADWPSSPLIRTFKKTYTFSSASGRLLCEKFFETEKTTSLPGSAVFQQNLVNG
jgi:hypothetical protein